MDQQALRGPTLRGSSRSAGRCYAGHEFSLAPQLWLCDLSGTLVACDDDGGFLHRAEELSVAEVVAQWETYRGSVLAGRKYWRRVS